MEESHAISDSSLVDGPGDRGYLCTKSEQPRRKESLTRGTKHRTGKKADREKSQGFRGLQRTSFGAIAAGPRDFGSSVLPTGLKDPSAVLPNPSRPLFRSNTPT